MCLVAALLTTAPAVAAAQAPPPLVITPSFNQQASVTPGTGIELYTSRPLDPSEGTLAVLIDTTDVTSLFTVNGTILSYGATIVPLPLDASAVTAYLVSPQNAWQLLATFPLHVAAPAENAVMGAPGPQTPAVAATPAPPRAPCAPSLTAGSKSQPAESHSPDAAAPPRTTFTDATMQGSLKADMAGPARTMHSGIDLIGSSFQGEALRFGQQGASAPNVDMPSYVAQVQDGRARFAMGHLLFAANRLLVDNLQSRGFSATVPLGQRVDLTAAALNGTTIVGWDNFTGVQEAHHRSFTGILGIEVLQRPGALRFELTTMDGSLLPITSFNRGSITDAEESRGNGVRVIATGKAQRLHLDGGFARSHFTNPDDPLLSGGVQVVPCPCRNSQWRLPRPSATCCSRRRRSISARLAWLRTTSSSVWTRCFAASVLDHRRHAAESGRPVW